MPIEARQRRLAFLATQLMFRVTFCFCLNNRNDFVLQIGAVSGKSGKRGTPEVDEVELSAGMAKLGATTNGHHDGVSQLVAY